MSIGSTVFGAIVIYLISLCRRFIRCTTGRRINSSNVNRNAVSVYDEIDIDVDEPDLRIERNPTTPRHTVPSVKNLGIIGTINDSQPDDRESSIIEGLNNYLGPISNEIRRYSTSADENEDINTEHEESDSPGENSNNNSRNRYFNINGNTHDSYQSLERRNSDLRHDNSYDQLNDNVTTSFHYINLQI